MKAWIVRFVSLYVFNVVVLLLMGLLPGVRVGLSALWAGVILTAATLWLKPVVAKIFRSAAAKSADRRTRTGEKLVQFGLVFAVELLIWIIVVVFTGVNVYGFLWGWILPPLALLLAWIVYDAIDDRIEARAGSIYDRATSGRRTDAAASAPPIPRAPSSTAPSSPQQSAGRRELRDGLTDERRRLFDEL